MDISSRFNKEVLIVSSPVQAGLVSFIQQDNHSITFTNVLENEAVEHVHRQQQAAGSHCITANTLDCLPSRLAKFGEQDKIDKLATSALQNVNAIKPQHVLIELGWTNLPLDDSSRNSLLENKNQYVEAGRVFEKTRNESTRCFDGYLLSELKSTTQIKCALMGLRQVTDRPIFCSVYCDKEGRVNKDESIYDAVQTITEFGAQVAGLKTSLEPKAAAVLIKRVRAATDLPIIVEFVVKRDEDGKLSVPYESPDTMKEAAIRACHAGATFLRAGGRPKASYTSVLSVCAGLYEGN